MEIIDPHLHLFDLQQGEYSWLHPGSPPYWPDKEKICKNYSESDLQLTGDLSLSGFVHIEAGFDNSQPWREIEWLETHCYLPFRSIAYADLTSGALREHLNKLSAYRSVVGIRHILDDQASELFKNPTFQKSLKLLEQQGLIFEAQFSLDDRPAIKLLTEQLEKVPELKIVINHAGLPTAISEAWMDSVTTLAKYPQCCVKCSGWEMQDRDWAIDTVNPFIQFLIRQFGLERVMLASNFPVSELACSYSELWLRYSQALPYTDLERKLLMHDTARRIYGLEI